MTPSPPSPKPPFSRFALALLIGGVIAVAVGSTVMVRATAEGESVLVPGIVTQVGDRQGRFMPVTYKYEAPGPDGKPRRLERTVLAPIELAEKWTPERQVQIRMAKANPERSDLAESDVAVATGLQWLVFGGLATAFGALRLRKKPDEA